MTTTAMTAEEFQVTELGPLPKEWAVVRLGELIEEVREKNKSNFQYPVFTVSNIHGLMLSDEFFDKRVYSKKLDTYKIICSDYFAYNPYRVNVGSIGLFSHGVGLVSPAYVVFRVSKPEQLDTDFLYRLIKSTPYLSEIRRIAMSRGSVRRSLSYKDLSDFRIPLPPLPEQKKIAYVLSTVQAAIEKTDAVFKAATELKKSLMKYLFTYGPVSIAEAENVTLREIEIGLVPEEWEVKPLVDIATLQRGKDLPKQEQVWGKYPVVGASGVMAYHNQAPCRGPGVVTGRSGSIGNLTYIEEDYWPHNTGLYVKDFHNNNPKFTYYLLHLIDFRKYATGVSVPTLNRNVVHAVMLPVPPIEVQRHIADILTTLDRRIETGENKKKTLEALFRTLLSNLMTGKIRVSSLEVPF